MMVKSAQIEAGKPVAKVARAIAIVQASMKGALEDYRLKHAAVRVRLVLACLLVLVLSTPLTKQARASENRFPVDSDQSTFPEGTISEKDHTVRLEVEMDEPLLRRYGVSKSRIVDTIKTTLASANIKFSQEKDCPVLYFTCYCDQKEGVEGVYFGVDAAKLSPRAQSDEYIEDWSLGDARHVVKTAKQILAAVKKLLNRLPLPYGKETKGESADPLT